MSLPITVIIRTVNEEKNISACIQSCLDNDPLEIIVVDGGSVDRTTLLAREFTAIKVIESEKGLVIQRNTGVYAASSEASYVAIVDADDQLDRWCLRDLMLDLERSGAVATQARHCDLSEKTGKKSKYWEQAFWMSMQVIRDLDKKQKEQNIQMVGRPALYQKRALIEAMKNNDVRYGSASEDSDLAYRLKRQGGHFVVGTGKTYRKYIDNFGELVSRWLSYGAGDYKFIMAHPERRWAVIQHLIYTYPIKRAVYCGLKYQVKYVPYFVLHGWVRLCDLVVSSLWGTRKLDAYRPVPHQTR